MVGERWLSFEERESSLDKLCRFFESNVAEVANVLPPKVQHAKQRAMEGARTWGPRTLGRMS